ncbi:unnamed protein product [Allacma fusca]|uniref:Ubiquitin-like domain-containing protein n=1 Tax=Allacma fusca TaxID=39272 RepID=A0A8J2JP44_9HEXA|nr:unnamed protein product [Allacma fusca]
MYDIKAGALTSVLYLPAVFHCFERSRKKPYNPQNKNMAGPITNRLSLDGSSFSHAPNRRNSSIHFLRESSSASTVFQELIQDEFFRRRVSLARDTEAIASGSHSGNTTFSRSTTSSRSSLDGNSMNDEELLRMTEELNWGIQKLPVKNPPRAQGSPNGRSGVRNELNVSGRSDQVQRGAPQTSSFRANYTNARRQSFCMGSQNQSQRLGTSRNNNVIINPEVSRNPKVRSDSVVVPGFGTAFRIIAVSRSGLETVVPLALSPDSRKFYALFKQDDVDFEIQYDNVSADRDALVELKVHNKRKTFVIPNSWKCNNQSTFETNGRKYHFVRQSGEEGQLNIGRLAADQSLTFEAASAVISRIGFSVRYTTPGFRISVKNLGGSTFPLIIHGTDTVEIIKYKIQYHQGSPVDQQKLVFSGVQLDNRKTAQECHIQPDSTINLVLRVIGGAAPHDSSRSFMEIHQSSNLRQDRHEFDIGELGAVVFGDRVERHSRSLIYSGYTLDNSVPAEDFTIELRLAPKYRIL